MYDRNHPPAFILSLMGLDPMQRSAPGPATAPIVIASPRPLRFAFTPGKRSASLRNRARKRKASRKAKRRHA